jgi:3-hydroxymyristoyl/3-hydroxydecanoyl-(acyl carrier protein) dehydratase
MPGVLIIESMAQTSCVLLLSKSGATGKLAYFMSIDKAKFRNPVTPGDILELHVEITRYNGKRGKAKGNAYVNKKKVAESEFAFVVVDKKRIE